MSPVFDERTQKAMKHKMSALTLPSIYSRKANWCPYEGDSPV